MNRCKSCKYYFYDHETGYSECVKADDFNDEEFSIYENGDWLDDCRHFEEQEVSE